MVDRAEGGLDAALAALERAVVELSEAQSEVARFADTLVFNPAELEETEDRLFALRGLARKHGIVPDDLERFGADLEARVAALDGGAEEIAGLRAAHRDAVAAWREAADRLSHARAEAAGRLDAAMAEELAPLKLERAVFSTVLAPAEPGPSGADQVTFTVATNPGAPAGPLNRIASGGELSRFLFLALKVCLTRDDSGLTMIFDEIDRGVRGRHRRCRGPQAFGAVAGRAGPRGDPFAAGRGPWRASLAGVQGGDRRHDAEPGGRRWPRRSASTKSRGCWRATP